MRPRNPDVVFLVVPVAAGIDDSVRVGRAPVRLFKCRGVGREVNSVSFPPQILKVVFHHRIGASDNIGLFGDKDRVVVNQVVDLFLNQLVDFCLCISIDVVSRCDHRFGGPADQRVDEQPDLVFGFGLGELLRTWECRPFGEPFGLHAAVEVLNDLRHIVVGRHSGFFGGFGDLVGVGRVDQFRDLGGSVGVRVGIKFVVQLVVEPIVVVFIVNPVNLIVDRFTGALIVLFVHLLVNVAVHHQAGGVVDLFHRQRVNLIGQEHPVDHHPFDFVLNFRFGKFGILRCISFGQISADIGVGHAEPG